MKGKESSGASTGLTIEQLSKLLSKTSGRSITEQMIRRDIKEGAPVNGDKTINLIHYGAWLASQIG